MVCSRFVCRRPGGIQEGFDVEAWEFPKIRGTIFWGPYKKDPSIQGTIVGSPIFGNSR